MQQSHVTFATVPAAADSNSGLPQVSVLTLKKQKDLIKKRREVLIAGKGRSYRAIGAHRRSTANKHTWTYSELAELTATFITHYNLKPLWRIAEEIHGSFALQLTHQQALDAGTLAAAATDPQEEQVAQLREPRTHLPTVTAVELKLMDCVSLHFNDTHNYISKPSQMHHEVWSHLLRAQKHRTMIRSMTAAKQEQQPAEAEDREIWNVHASEFMYDTAAEYEAAFPSAKRRKFNPEDEVVVVVGEIEMGDDTASNDKSDTMCMGEICEALDEIADQIDEREQNRQSTYAAVNASLVQIQSREQQIAQLLTALRDATTEIETHRQEIACEMERIRAIVDPAPPTYSAPVTTTPTIATAHVDPNDQFDPNHYECRECSQMFDPLVPGYWLIGPNRETGDTFYLCRECTRFMGDTPQTPRAPATHAQRIDEEEDNQDCGGDCDCDCDCWDNDSEGEWEDYEEEPKQGDYDHSEECS
jgi:hypothetical protein